MTNTNDFCTINNLTNIIKKQKKTGQKNQEIIKLLTNKGCCFQQIFNAMDAFTKKRGKPNEPIQSK